MSIKRNCKKPEWIAASSALVSGVIAHGFALVNVIHNYDNILQQPKGYGAGITYGRWLLEALGDFNDAFVELNFNLPTMNGLGFLLLIALSTALMVNSQGRRWYQVTVDGRSQYLYSGYAEEASWRNWITRFFAKLF